QPLLLRRAGGHGDAGAAAVQHDDVPGAEVVAVVALRRIAGGGAEVAEVPRGAGCLVIALPRGRLRAGLVPAPGRVVALVLRRRAAVISVVAGREDGPWDPVEQVGGGVVVAGLVATRDVARAHQRRRAGGRGGARRRLGQCLGSLVVIAGAEDHTGR